MKSGNLVGVAGNGARAGARAAGFALRLATAIAVAGVLACARPDAPAEATPQATPQATPEATPVPYRLLAPDLDRAMLGEVERRGYDIYLRDVVAHRGTDAAQVEADLAGSGAVGWIVVPYERGMLMRFIDGSERAVIDVSVDPHTLLSPFVTTNVPPKELSPRERSMWRARKLVSEQPFAACSDRYSGVVIPTSDQPDSEWLVYLLAATIDPTVLVFGGHHRFRVDPGGQRILEHTPLSKSCLTMIHSDSTQAIAISLALFPEPLETHAYFSLLHGIPLRVFTIEGGEHSWLIEDGRIQRQATH